VFPLRILFINVKKKTGQKKSLPKAAPQIQGSLVQWKCAVLRIIEMGRAKNPLLLGVAIRRNSIDSGSRQLAESHSR
jgi:hypothetical protein